MGKLVIDAILARLDALESALLGAPRQRLSKSEVAKAEGCSTREVMRRVGKGRLPPPDDVIANRLYWWSDSIERHRRAPRQPDTAAARAARNPQLRPRKPALPAPET